MKDELIVMVITYETIWNLVTYETKLTIWDHYQLHHNDFFL